MKVTFTLASEFGNLLAGEAYTGLTKIHEGKQFIYVHINGQSSYVPSGLARIDHCIDWNNLELIESEV